MFRVHLIVGPCLVEHPIKDEQYESIRLKEPKLVIGLAIREAPRINSRAMLAQRVESPFCPI